MSGRTVKIVKEWQVDDVLFTVKRFSMPADVIEALEGNPFIKTRWLCGYVTFPAERLSTAFDVDEIETDVTYQRENEDGTITIGFDKNHASDIDDPRSMDVEHVAGECVKLAHELGLLTQENEG